MSRYPISFNRTSLGLIFWFAGLILQPAFASSAGVAVIKSQDLLPYDQAVQGFRSLAAQKVTEYNMKGEVGEGLKIVEEIKRQKPAAVLAVGSKAAALAKENLPEIPLVYCVVIDPEKYGLRAGNVTGIALEIPVGAQLKAFKTVVPGLKRVGVVYDPDKTSGLIRVAYEEAHRLGLELVAVEVSSEKELPRTIRNLLPNIQGLWMIPDSTVMTTESFQLILLMTLEKNIPFMAFSNNFVKAGALLALSPDYFMIGRQSSLLLDQIVRKGMTDRGKMIYPDTARLTINIKTAKILGLEIPEEVLKTADVVFQ
ncbi:MAG: ABC transporter substrate-binding protein [Nitrospirae bacterium]|nr:ABC transporter substrate-binding protein [Nitrospirota bacterium]